MMYKSESISFFSLLFFFWIVAYLVLMNKFPNFCTPRLLLLNHINYVVVVVILKFSWIEFESILTTKKIMHANTHPINSRRKITQPKPMQHKIISLYTQTTIVTYSSLCFQFLNKHSWHNTKCEYREELGPRMMDIVVVFFFFSMYLDIVFIPKQWVLLELKVLLLL